MISGISCLPILASLRAALDQPVFPGKILVWLLFMLSIVGWVMILSKIVHLRKVRRADREFTERLRKSKTTLEVFEEGWEDDLSLKHLIYQAGARETAYQLLGSREPQEMMVERLRQAGKLTGRRLEFLRMAFQTGFRAAVGRLQTGIEGLALIAAAALIVGTFGFVWTLMKGFDEAKEFAELAPRAGGALGCLAVAILVAAPAILARIGFRIVVRRRELELERFRDDIDRLFERSFAGTSEEGPSTPRSEPARHGSPPSPLTNEPMVEAGEEKKRFHSIRDRLLRSEAEEEASNPFQVNPIARQAATVGAKALH